MLPNTKSFFLSVGILLFVFYFTSILTPVVWLSLGLSISKSSFIGTIIFTLISSVFITKNIYQSPNIQEIITVNITTLIVLLLCGGIANYFFDNTFDGQSYHYNSIINLVEDWNPIYDFGAENYYVDNWVILYYPKASWYSASNIITFFENAKLGKMYNLVLIFATFFMSTVIIKENTKLHIVLTIILALSLSFNIISINQIFTFYLDGQISSLIIIVLLSAILYFQKPQKLLFLSVLLGSLVTLVNLKFPALVYSVIFGGAFLLFNWHQNGKQHFLRLSMIFGLVFLIGFLGVGFNPYFSNLFSHGHPFYPLNEVNLLTHENIPQNFNGVNRFYKLFHSLFSYQGHIVREASTILKSPFSQGLMNTYGLPDTRIGAFGPYFPLVLICSILALIPVIIYKENKKVKFIAAIISLAVIISILIHPESWWGRYIPQLFLLPFLITIILLISKRKILKIAGGLLFGLILFNQINISISYIKYNLQSTTKLNQQFEKMRTGKTTIYLCEFPSLAYRLNNESVDFQIVNTKEDLPCPEAEALHSFPCKAFFCVEKEEEK